MPYLPCALCKKIVYKRPSKIESAKNIFCSQKCNHAFRDKRLAVTCANCGSVPTRKRRLGEISRTKTKRFFCNQKCLLEYQANNSTGYLRNGYIFNGDVAQHRKVMETHIGRKLLNEEHVHHVNGIKTDNRIENLVIMTHSEHSHLHSSRQIKIREEFSCIDCGKTREYTPCIWNTFYSGDKEKMKSVYRCKGCYVKTKRWLKSSPHPSLETKSLNSSSS